MVLARRMFARLANVKYSTISSCSDLKGFSSATISGQFRGKKMCSTLPPAFDENCKFLAEKSNMAKVDDPIKKKLPLLKSKKISLVIFDKDGTLICFDSMWVPWAKEIAKNIGVESEVKNIESAVYNILGYCPIKETVKTGMLAEGTMQQIRRKLTGLLMEHGMHQQKADETIENAWVDCDTSKPGALRALGDLVALFKALKAHGTKIAICTSDNRKSTEASLQHLGLTGYIDMVVCGNDVGVRPKPDPRTVLQICEQLNIKPEETAMVGDTVVDVQMARSAGLGFSVGVLSGVGRVQDLRSKSDILLESVQHLTRHFSKPHPGLLSRIVKNPSTFWNSQQTRQFSSLTAAPHGKTRTPSDSWPSTSQRRNFACKPPPEDVKPTHIVVGAGSAGCVLANRLTENPENRVFLIEAGPSDDWWRWKIHMPSALMYNLSNDRYNWHYHTLPQGHMDERVMYCPRGRVWGGSSALNAMVYIRGHAKDYDRWAHKEGATGWSYADCLPYFKKSENFDGKASDYRGDNGPLHVHRFDGKSTPLYAAFLEAGVQAGYDKTDDMNGYKQEGFGFMDANIYKGKRWSASQAYMWPIMDRPNFFYESRIMVSKIIVDKYRAIGVETVGSKEDQNFEKRKKRIYTEKDVILCGGAINTPQILMLSGIGHEAVLKAVDIPVVKHLPGVGANLQDHLEMYVQQKCTKPITLYDKSTWRHPHNMAAVGLQWLTTKSGLGATNHLETGGFVRTDDENDHPNVQFHFLPSAVVDHGRQSPTCHAFQVHVGPMRPTSRGFVKLTSKNPFDPPAINFNYLQTEFDRREMRDCVRIARRLFEQTAFDEFRAGEMLPGPRFSAGSNAEPSKTVPNSQDEDKILDAFAREFADSAYHPSCTCKMGPKSDASAVVDPETLAVYGMDNLRVVDSSIMPSVVSGNLNAPVIMMAEKAADILQGKKPLKPLTDVPVWSHLKRSTQP